MSSSGISEMSIFLVSGSLCVCLVSALIIKIFHKLWWVPHRLQKLMHSQGIRGPSYRFIFGSTKEMMRLRNQAMAKPLELSDHNIFPRIQPHVHSWTKLYGRNYLEWYGNQAHLVVTETELIKEMLNDRDRVFTKPKPNDFSKKIFGDGIVMSTGEKWAKMRKLASHAFQTESLKGMVPAMVASVETMIERWKNHDEGQEIDVYEEFRLLTAEVISKTAFGSSYLEGKLIFEMLEKLTIIASESLMKPRLISLFKTSKQVEAEKIEKGIHEAIRELIKKREDKVKSGEEDSFGGDFLGLLLKAHHDEKLKISVDDVVDECKTLYFAGQETTNSLLAWAILLLSTHTDWQEKARKEVLDSFGKNIPDADGISKLGVMSMIVNETLRLYPPAPTAARLVEREVGLGSFKIPANVLLSAGILASHHDPEIWGADVHLFKPERFADGVAKATKNNSAAFLPFGMGPRTCLGFNFAINEAKIALSMILQRYMLALSPTYVHSPIQVLTLRPQHGVQVVLHRV